jgi:hypothetical protein
MGHNGNLALSKFSLLYVNDVCCRIKLWSLNSAAGQRGARIGGEV